MANKARDPRKEQFWRQAVAGWRRSGLTVRVYCARHGLSEPSFYAWRSELTRRDRHAAEQRSKTSSFVPVRVVTEPQAPIEIVLADGHVVRVRPGFDAQTLRQVLAVAREERPC